MASVTSGTSMVAQPSPQASLTPLQQHFWPCYLIEVLEQQGNPQTGAAGSTSRNSSLHKEQIIKTVHQVGPVKMYTYITSSLSLTLFNGAGAHPSSHEVLGACDCPMHTTSCASGHPISPRGSEEGGDSRRAADNPPPAKSEDVLFSVFLGLWLNAALLLQPPLG
ncbi:CD99 antigen [Platysternon megacephalum]|uniref:CD99 antigen n=1 Tax=Platysternon megacephalum TaxID=55544 RepID=A0A4D9EDK7_9SAUR|nr:CD99 antigen [Platysternon megacephalum]